MVSRDILNSHPIAHLKKEISKTNIKGYSKMKKTEIIELMMKTPERFSHITMMEKKKTEPKKVVVVKKLAVPKADVEPKGDKEPERPQPKKKEEPKKVVEKKVEEQFQINYRNKKKNFKPDSKKFKSYEAAKKWGKKNIDNFNEDMIN